MRSVIIALAAVCVMATAGQALADDCAAQFHAGGAIELKAPLDDPTRLGLAESLRYGLARYSPDWPLPEIKAAPACQIAQFTAGGAAYTLSGGTGALPFRWASSPSSNWIVYLAAAPSIEEAYDDFQQGTPSTIRLKKPAFVLVVTNESMRHVVRFYDGLPATDVLAADMAAALEQRLPLIADFDPIGRAVSVRMPTTTPSPVVMWPPGPGEGGPPARITVADGKLFVPDAQGAFAMDGSGFRCPEWFGALRRRDMWIANATQEKRDLSCRYMAPSGASAGWISIFVTRLADRPAAQTVFDKYVNEGHAAVPPAMTIQPPVATGRRPAPTYVDAWQDMKGMDEAVWLSAMDDWYVEVRATYAPAQTGAFRAAVAKVFADAYREIGKPG